jgi:hypothetical protein
MSNAAQKQLEPSLPASEFMSLPYVPFAPVRRQLLGLLGRVNRRRKEGQLELSPDMRVGREIPT